MDNYFSFVENNTNLTEETATFCKALSPRRTDILHKAITDAENGKTKFLEIARKQRADNFKIQQNLDVYTDYVLNSDEKISLRIYKPKNKNPKFIILYLHGGGWVLGSADSCGRICSDLALELNSVVIAVEYRLSPEFKFPIPLEDCVLAVEWAIKTFPNKKLFISGDSAGGNLALATTIKLLKESKKISGLALFYPVATQEECVEDASWQNFGKGFALDSKLMTTFTQAYLRSPEDIINTYASPILHNNFSDFPPTIIIASGKDILHDQCIRLAKKISQTNKFLRLVDIKMATHIYATMDGMDKSYKIGFTEVKNFFAKIGC